MDICIVENGRVFSSGLSIVAAYANVGPFFRSISVEGCEDVDELAV